MILNYTHIHLHYSHSLPLPGAVLTLCTNPDSQTVVLQLTDGTVLQYTSPSSCSPTRTTTQDSGSTPSSLGAPANYQPSLSPWLLPDGRGMKFPDTYCEHVAMATFKNKVDVDEHNLR